MLREDDEKINFIGIYCDSGVGPKACSVEAEEQDV
jgi:hypothetical protein